MDLNDEEINKAIKLIEISDTKYALKNIKYFYHNTSEDQLKELFGSQNSIKRCFGYPIITNKNIPKGEIWMMDNDNRLLKSFKI